MPAAGPSHNADKAPAKKPAPKQAPPQAAGPAPAGPRSLQDLLADPLQATPAQLAQLQRQYGNAAVQRLIQRAQAPDEPRVGAEGGPVAADIESQIGAARGGGQSLDSATGAQMGAALGADLSGVRVHTDTQADDLNRSLSAEAFTLGSDVFFREGAYDPHSASGQHLLAHELTHVVQQGGAPAVIQTQRPVDSGQGVVEDQEEDEEDLSGAFEQLFGSQESGEGQGPEEEDEEDLSRAFEQLFGNQEDTGKQEQDQEEDEEDLSGAFELLFGSQGETGEKQNTGGKWQPGSIPTSAPTSSVTIGAKRGATTPGPALPQTLVWQTPAIPRSLTPAGEKLPGDQTGAVQKESRGLFSKLLNRNTATSESPLNVALMSLSAMHRGVRWYMFDPAVTIKLNVSEAQLSSGAALKEAMQEFEMALDEDEVEQADLRKAKAQLDLTRANTQQAQAALNAAQAEHAKSLPRLIAKVTELITVLQKSGGAQSAQKLRDAQQFANQLINVADILTVFQRRVEALREMEPPAFEAWQEIARSLKEKGKLGALGGQEVEDSDSEDAVAVESVLGAQWFNGLQRIKFHEASDLYDWIASEELRLSARDGRPDNSLRRFQEDAERAMLAFATLLDQLDTLKGKKLERPDAISELKKMWVQIGGVTTKPGPRGPNIIKAHKGWLDRQTTLAGDRNKLEDWKKKHPAAMQIHNRVEQILKEDMRNLLNREQELNRAR